MARHHLRCPRCGYDLHALESARCPECGVRITMTLLKHAVNRRGENWLAIGASISVFVAFGTSLVGILATGHNAALGTLVALVGLAMFLAAATSVWAWDHPFSPLGRGLFGLRSILLAWSPLAAFVLFVLPLLVLV